jgi:hypothetical protein
LLSCKFFIDFLSLMLCHCVILAIVKNNQNSNIYGIAAQRLGNKAKVGLSVILFLKNQQRSAGQAAVFHQTKPQHSAGRYQECMALPLSLSTTKAQLRPAAPCTPPPGCAPATHARY